jgi:ribosomal peptide maturation radical SAM protein 1
MENQKGTQKPRIAIISTPWPLFNRPSIQLGSLKAYLRAHRPETEVENHHFYLSVAAGIGYGLYREISESTWLSEAPYAALLYPEREEKVKRFWLRHSKGLEHCRKTDFFHLLRRLEKLSKGLVGGVVKRRYPVIGFSICLGQLSSTLYFLRQIKNRTPRCKIVVGGSACSRELGLSLLRQGEEIDAVISGEGEKPLLRFIERECLETSAHGKGGPIPGLLEPDGNLDKPAKAFGQVSSMDDLPAPDFQDYFDLLKTLAPEKRFLPHLPMEASRGCWWRKATDNTDQRGCAFCNLNLQWEGYRHKSPTRVFHELGCLTAKHGILSVSFMDNLLPVQNMRPFFRRAAASGKDFKFFSEIRATTSREDLMTMWEAGVKELQVGIESLSSRVLKKLNKGVTAIQNLEIMKNCEARNTPDLTGNIILHFPGTDEQDVQETLETLKVAMVFRPLKAIPFWLGLGSPVWYRPKQYGITRIHNHPFYAHLFPAKAVKDWVFMIQGYHGGVRMQHRRWLPVKETVETWQKRYRELHGRPGSTPILSYRDGLRFLIIKERRIRDDPMTHRLRGRSREIYLYCETNRDLNQILHRFPGLGEDRVLPFLKMMLDKGLMFREGNRYLSLAVPVRGWSRPQSGTLYEITK